MPDVINGLPGHALLVHGVVVLLPLAAVLLAAAALLPAVRARLGLALPALAAVCVVLVPLTTRSGEWLEERLGAQELVRRHSELGESLLPWSIALLGVSLLVWFLGRRQDTPSAAPARLPAGSRGAASTVLLVRVGVAVLAVAVSAGTLVQTVRTGDSGAKAVWSGVTDES